MSNDQVFLYEFPPSVVIPPGFIPTNRPGIYASLTPYCQQLTFERARERAVNSMWIRRAFPEFDSQCRKRAKQVEKRRAECGYYSASEDVKPANTAEKKEE